MKLGTWIVESNGINECNQDVTTTIITTGGDRTELESSFGFQEGLLRAVDWR